MSAGPENAAHPAAPEAFFSVLPPYLVRDGFLDESMAAELFAYAVASEANFAPTKIGPKEKVNPDFRNSVGTRELGTFAPLLKTRLKGMVAEFIAALKSSPIGAPRVELELVAHNDGALFKRHIDTRAYASPGSLRVLSGVYYFHAPQKSFSGGALRLHAIGGGRADHFVDVEPTHNRFVLFPSWAPHEVLPITCSSRRFCNSRFAINCWIHDKNRMPQPQSEP